MKKSFADLIQSTCSKSSLDEKDIEWIGSLCVELKTRINGLTPSRGDLHADLETKFDIELLKQMLRHNACEIDDVRPLVSTLQSRISMLCAPVQDQEVKKIFDEVSTSNDMGSIVKTLIVELNAILDETYRLNEVFRRQSQSAY